VCGGLGDTFVWLGIPVLRVASFTSVGSDQAGCGLYTLSVYKVMSASQTRHHLASCLLDTIDGR
jgi:hypothetical protein